MSIKHCVPFVWKMNLRKVAIRMGFKLKPMFESYEESRKESAWMLRTVAVQTELLNLQNNYELPATDKRILDMVILEDLNAVTDEIMEGKNVDAKRDWYDAVSGVNNYVLVDRPISKAIKLLRLRSDRNSLIREPEWVDIGVLADKRIEEVMPLLEAKMNWAKLVETCEN